MRRRQFLVLSGAMAAWPLVAHTQTRRLPRIGILVLGNPDPAVFLREFREGLREAGYVEGKTVIFEFRSGRGSNDGLLAMARELVAYKVDAIVAWQTPAVLAAKEATTEIPIVMSPAADPLGMRLIASYARPGGNITGFASATAEVSQKNLELVRDVLPSARRIGVLANAADPFHKPFIAHIEKGAGTLGYELDVVRLAQADELAAALARLANQRADAVIVQPSLPRAPAAELAIRHRLPLFAPSAEFALAGALLSYSTDILSIYRAVPTYVAQIIKGRKPADLPVQLPTKFQLIVNLKTAKALGLTLPPALLTRADQVIE